MALWSCRVYEFIDFEDETCMKSVFERKGDLCRLYLICAIHNNDLSLSCINI